MGNHPMPACVPARTSPDDSILVRVVEPRPSVVVTRQVFFDAGLQPLDLALLQYLWFLPPATPLTHPQLVTRLQGLGWRSANGHPIGRDAVYQALTHLIDAGFVHRSQGRCDDGHLGPVVFEIYEDPHHNPHHTPDPASPQLRPASGFTGHGDAAYREDGSGPAASSQVTAASGEAVDGWASPTPPTPGRENPPSPPQRRPMRAGRRELGGRAGGRISTSTPAGAVPEPLPDPEQLAVAAELLASLTDHRHDLHLGQVEIDGLAGLAARWLQRGATPGQLVAALTTGLPATIDRPAGLIADRLRRKIPRPRAAAPAPTDGIPPWCGGCDPAGEHNPAARFVEREDGTVARCPRCHPTHAAQAQRDAA